jgi:hypothetical protein
MEERGEGTAVFWYFGGGVGDVHILAYMYKLYTQGKVMRDGSPVFSGRLHITVAPLKQMKPNGPVCLLNDCLHSFVISTQKPTCHGRNVIDLLVM